MVLVATLALFVAGAFVALLVGASVARKFARSRADAREQRIVAEFRPRLMELLAEDDPCIDELVRAGGRQGESEIIDLLAYRLMTKLRGRDRAVLAELLTRRGAFESARRRTHRFGAVGRARAVEVLGSGDPVEATPELGRLLQDRHLEVRVATARAVGSLGVPSAVPQLMKGLVADRLPLSVVGMAIVHLGTPCCPHLRMSLRSPHVLERRLASECLGLFGDIEAVEALLPVAEHDVDLDTRCAAVKALGQIGDPRVEGFLVQCIHNDGPFQFRAEAATSLGRLGDPGVVHDLRAALRARQPDLARAAAHSLGQLGPAGAKVLFDSSQRHGYEAAYAREALDFAALRPTRERSFA